MIRTLLRLLITGSFLFLHACAITPEPSLSISTELKQQSWQQHRQAVAQYQNWTLTARIIVNTEDDGWNGQLSWHQSSDAYQIQFIAPFGQGAIQLDGDSQNVEMRLSDGRVFTDTDAESLLFRQLGWHFPLKGLRYWLMGLPVPEHQLDDLAEQAVMTFNQWGRLATLQQSYWQIRYPDYQQVGNVLLPRKVYIENTQLSVRLVIDRWDLSQGS